MLIESSNDTCFASSVAEISWKAFEHNWSVIASKVSPTTDILPMVKSNAYGHDLAIISQYCDKLGAIGLGVANMFEAIELRSIGYEKRIVSFGKLNAEILDAAHEFNIAIVIHQLEDLDLISKYKHPLTFHLEIETGMNRLGISSEMMMDVAKFLTSFPHYMEGVFTHWVESEIKKSNFTEAQNFIFNEAVTMLATVCRRPFVTHMDNSGGIFNNKTHGQWVRPGISLYGYSPNPKTNFKLKPVMQWTSKVMQIKHLQKGDCVSYNRSFQAKRNMTIATLPVGYGDGFARNYKTMSIGYKGQKCPIVGNVCMDLMMIDISKVKSPKVGDDVYLMGSGTKKEPGAWDYAKVDRTIPYEVLTRISPRVLRTNHA
jgi:alanine racemase